MVAPDGPVYQAGTLSGNPLAMAAGLATLRQIDATPGFYEPLERLGARLEAGLRAQIARGGYPCRVARVASMWTLFFTADDVVDWTRASPVRHRTVRRVLPRDAAPRRLLAPSQFEANFISIAHSDADIDETVSAAGAALDVAWA